MQSSEIRSRFLKFFEKRGHAVIPSASLVTTDEKGVTNITLFNTAGMQPLIPFLLGKVHPSGNRLVDSQKCLRTIDIDDVGDKTHATFFEMLGNWSLGDYFKDDAIAWSYEFLTSKEEGLGLDPSRLYVTVFAGDENSPKDTESAEVWQKVGIPKNRIYFKDASSNWWPAVKPGKEVGWTGPTGPCSEMFYDITEKGLGDLSPQEFEKADAEQKVVEIWNDVFMAFEKVDGKIVGNLKQKNVDTGAGLERLCAVLQKKDNIFETDLFSPVMEKIENESDKNYWNIRSARIIADHLRASIFLIADGMKPSSTDRGYVLRKLIRRAILHKKLIKLNILNLSNLVTEIINVYPKDIYPELTTNKEKIIEELGIEGGKFIKTIDNGDKELTKIFIKARDERIKITGSDLFRMYDTYGFPIELSFESLDISNRNQILNKEVYNKEQILNDFKSEFKKHQDLSRSGAEKKFKGGLADTSEMSLRYHTATHLLHQALHDVLGDSVMQKGSNITPERLRFDFAHSTKMTDEEKKRVEDIVNEKIRQALPVNNVVMPKTEAEKTDARHFFGEKYGDEVSIYFIGNNLTEAYSKEFCGGPHVKNTTELAGPEGKWKFKIQKEEAVAQGIRRIKAVLE